ncbi:MAG: hypothetical protein IPK13_07840 [Deltaproteobacteria bacterium]|nr:hypothetical protein [Deltaproteobacteria bacterium]
MSTPRSFLTYACASYVLSISALLWLGCSGDSDSNAPSVSSPDAGETDGSSNGSRDGSTTPVDAAGWTVDASVVVADGGWRPPISTVDTDSDSLPNAAEDRDQDGVVDPGETDPSKSDTDGDGILDSDEVFVAACSLTHDRPFRIHDLPGADSEVLVDADVSVHGMPRLPDNRAPGGIFYDPSLQVAAILIGKRPAQGVTTPAAQRDYEQRNVLTKLGSIESQRTRSFETVEGFKAEQAGIRLRLGVQTDAASLINAVATGLVGDVPLSGTLPAATTKSVAAVVNVLTIYRSASRVVVLVAAVVGETPSDAQLLRLEEFTDGTNVARHGAFTRHLCDEFAASGSLSADILWVVDDSGSMGDDQEAVRAAADAMGDVLTSAQVDYRLAVTRTISNVGYPTNTRGTLEGNGFTRNLNTFKDDVVVGVTRGGWEPGLETGLLALDRLLPKTAVGADDPYKLREDAAVIVIHLSDERDQTVECTACPVDCQDADFYEGFCSEPAGQAVLDEFIANYRSHGAVTFALVGDLPNGCQQSVGDDEFEPGQGYVEVANATGGQFGSLCGDMRQNLEDIGRGAIGVASTFTLSHVPASATLKVAIGPPGEPHVIPRSRENGFDFDAVSNKIIFYGDSKPQDGWEIAVGYRQWDWAGNPDTPSGACDDCDEYTSCAPELDVALCQAICGDAICTPGSVCVPDTGRCGDPSELENPSSNGCTQTCDVGLVCDPTQDTCVVPCESAGCDAGEICNTATHLCQIPNF